MAWNYRKKFKVISAVSKGQFPVIASEAKQTRLLIINGLLRAKRPRNDGFETFETASYNHSKPLSTYAMSVEDMQIITDIDFFPALPNSIEKQIESQVDFTQWNINTHK